MVGWFAGGDAGRARRGYFRRAASPPTPPVITGRATGSAWASSSGWPTTPSSPCPRLRPGSVVLGDGRFGILIIAFEARKVNHDVPLRPSEPRFEALKCKASCRER